MKFVGDVQRGEDGDFQRVDRQSARRDLAHPAVDKFGELNNVFSVAVRPNVVGLVVDLNAMVGLLLCASILPLLIMRPIPELI
jgi:hypothetical protein